MAFMGIFLMFAAAALIIIGVSTFIAVIFYIIAFVVSRKAKKEGRRSVGAIVMRVIATVFMLPLAGTVVMFVYGAISTKIEHTNNLGYSVSHYDLVTVEKLLKKGYSPECALGSKEPPEDGGMTLLSAVICNSDSDFRSHTDEERRQMIKLLIEYGADVNAVTYHHSRTDTRHSLTEEKDFYLSDDKCGYTPLLYAVYYGDFETVKLLTESGADINVRDWCGFDVVSTIADNLDDEKGAEMLQYFLGKGVSTKNYTNYGQSAGFLASRNGNPLNQFPAENDRIQAMIRNNGGGGGW